MKKTGLTLGKFAPLHKGHMYLIDSALKEVDELVVMIYQSSVTNIPLNVRAGWIRKLYPDVTLIECWDGPEGYSNDRDFEIEQENYILKKLDGRKITHFFSSEFYGDHVSKALGAADIRVDEKRENVNISATKIRSDQVLYRKYIPDVVYRDLVIKVVFVGAMSTGKSTITKALSEKYNTSFADEYGRDYWMEHQVDRRLSFEDFNNIAEGHMKREEKAFLKAGKYCFIDTNAITTYMYCLDYHGSVPEDLENTALKNAGRYDIFFLCDIDIPFDDTWDRSGPQKREVFQNQVVADLEMRKIPYILLQGSLEERIEKVERVLDKFTPFTNFYGRSVL